MHELVYRVKRRIDKQEEEGLTPSKIRMHPLDIQLLQREFIPEVREHSIYGSTLFGVTLEPDCAVARDNPQVDS